MSTTERVTVTLPSELVDVIDRIERNRSRFIREAIEQEVTRRRREELRRSLTSPHPEAAELAGAGFDEWAACLPEEEPLVDLSTGRPVRWVENDGWVEEAK